MTDAPLTNHDVGLAANWKSRAGFGTAERKVIYGGHGAHGDMCRDLAQHLRRAGQLTWVEAAPAGIGSRRIDVLAITPFKYAQPDIRAYEVKVSRSDFAGDVRDDKWRNYLGYAGRVYFAVDASLLPLPPLPNEAGLIVRGPNGWSVRKVATSFAVTQWTLPDFLALMSRGPDEDWHWRRLADRIDASENIALEHRARRIGHEIAQRLASKTVEAADRKAASIATVVRELFGDLEGYELAGTLRELLNAKQYIDLIRLLADITQVLTQIGRAHV